MTETLQQSPVRRQLGTPQAFFRHLELHADQADLCSHVISELRSGSLTGIVVRGVYDEGFMADVTQRLEAHDPPFLKTMFPEKFRSWFYGRNLNLMGTDPATYFQQAAEFQQHMQQLFPEKRGFQQTVMKLLSELDGGRPYRAAPGPDVGQSYMPTTFRGHAEGGYIPPHCDNEQSVRPAYEHLATMVSPHMYSMILMIAAADAGGDLEVFDYHIEPQEAGERTGAIAGKVDLNQLSSVQIRLQPGDMVIVDSGRYLHQVTPVIGPTTRWVACSFMAHSRERNAVYCWG
ncbi:MAG: 2OG-Fe(II) oxygenase [Planctomycetaceae bacterium]